MRLRTLIIVVMIGMAAGWYLIRPQPLAPDSLAGFTPDPADGAIIFAAAGCASCHAAEGGPADLMAGGKRFTSDFGTFVAPNISSDPIHGVGSWTDLELASAIMRGVGRDGAHLYPSLPYPAYNKAEPQDVVDLIAYLHSLPASDRPSEPHEIGFPFNQRILLGGWKLLFVGTD